jgi:hypothetical protein
LRCFLSPSPSKSEVVEEHPPQLVELLAPTVAEWLRSDGRLFGDTCGGYGN